MKEYDCAQVGHHDRIAEVISEYKKSGWRLHTYQAQGSPTIVNHYCFLNGTYDANIKKRQLATHGQIILLGTTIANRG